MAVVQVAIEDLDTWLGNQPDNTASTPYEVEVTGITADNKNTLTFTLQAHTNIFLDLRETQLPSILSLQSLFSACTNLVYSPAIPEGVEEIGAMYNGCTSLVEAPVLPSTITNINGTFINCTSLQTPPVIPNTVTDMQSSFKGSGITVAPVLPNGITSLYQTFMETPITNAPVIPDGVSSLVFAFASCGLLTTVPIIPNSVRGMYQAFHNCFNLTSASIPSSVTDLYQCFEGCRNLVSLKINKSDFSTITSKSDAFRYCNSLVDFYCNSQLSLKDWLDSLSSSDFPKSTADCNFYTYDYPNPSVVPFSELNTFLQGVFANTAQTPYKLNVTELTVSDIRPSGGLTGSLGNVIRNNSTKYVDLSETTLPNGVIDMTSCFDGCISLTTAPVIPNSVINMYACFLNCTSLTTAPNIPDSVTDMQLCFYTCFSLTTVPNIPNSVTDMSECFFSCSSLEEVTLFEADLESLITNNKAQGCFSDCTSLTKIGVPPSDQPTESDWHAFRLKLGASTVEGKVYDQTGTAVTIPQTTVTKATLELPIKTDELWFPSGLNDNEIDAIIEKVIQYRYTYWNKEVLDPAEKNFVLWADDPDNVKTNLVPEIDVADTVQSGNMNPVTSNAVADKISSLDVSSVGGSGKYISAISETDGKISATATDLGNMVPVNTVTSGNMHSVTSNAVYNSLLSLLGINNFRVFNLGGDGTQTSLRITYSGSRQYSAIGFLIISRYSIEFIHIELNDQANFYLRKSNIIAKRDSQNVTISNTDKTITVSDGIVWNNWTILMFTSSGAIFEDISFKAVT